MALIRYTDVPQGTFTTVNLARPSFAIRIENNTNIPVSVHDDRGEPLDDCPPGLTIGWNHTEGLYSPSVGCTGPYAGTARVYFYDTAIDLAGNPPAQQPPGTIPVSITNGSITVQGNVNATIAGNVSFAPGSTVNIGTMPAVNVFGTVTANFAAGSAVIANLASGSTIIANLAANSQVNIGTMPNVNVTGSVSITSGTLNATITNATLTVADSLVGSNTSAISQNSGLQTNVFAKNVYAFNVAANVVVSQVIAYAINTFSVLFGSLNSGFLSIWYTAPGAVDVYLARQIPYFASQSNIAASVEKVYRAPIPANSTIHILVAQGDPYYGWLKW